MSMSDWEVQQDIALSEFIQSIEDEYHETYRNQAVLEHRKERLQTYYGSHMDIAIDCIVMGEKALEIEDIDSTASLLLSSIATEVLIKFVIIKPLVTGFVTQESIAELVSELIMNRTGIQQYSKLLFESFDVLLELDCKFRDYKRQSSKKTLWEERCDINTIRNKIAHQAFFCERNDAKLSNRVFSEFLKLTHRLLDRLDFHVDEKHKIRFGTQGQRRFKIFDDD